VQILFNILVSGLFHFCDVMWCQSINWRW